MSKIEDKVRAMKRYASYLPNSRSACHVLIARTAKEMAGVAYDEYALKNNEWYRKHPDRNLYIAEAWSLFIHPARGLLARVLAEKNIPESYKQEIYEALILDNSLQKGRRTMIQARV